MEPLLYLVHRIPYPPNKGDKIRSYHILRHLSEHFRVYLGAFVDDPDDEVYLPFVNRLCAETRFVRLDPRVSRVRALLAIPRGEALTVAYYRNREMAEWVRRVVSENSIQKSLVFSSAMAQYVPGARKLHRDVDLVDVDSQKWCQYSKDSAWPRSMLYRRECAKLLEFERSIAWCAQACTLVTPAEKALFAELAPECAPRLHVVKNGVDYEFFSPDPSRVSPYKPSEEPIVFTGAMDYRPNVEAVRWFAEQVFQKIVAERTAARFYIVGMNPTQEVMALSCDKRVTVTGRVDDVRPFLQHAAVVVAPIRIARGVQNKVLEAMSMARPVVATVEVAAGIDATPGVDLEIAADAADFASRVTHLLSTGGVEMASRARQRIIDCYTWAPSLEKLLHLLTPGHRSMAQAEVCREYG